MAQQALPPVLAHVEIDGVEPLSRQDALEALGWQEGAPFSGDDVAASMGRLLEAYGLQGRPFAEADAPRITDSEGAVEVHLTVRAGPRAVLDRLEIVGANAISDETIRLRTGAPFDEEHWTRGLERLLRRYANNGRPLAVLKTEVTHAEPATGGFGMRLHVDEGPLVTIESVNFDGLHRTRESFLRRLIPIQAGDVYDQRRIDQARHLLRNSGLFATIHPSDVQRGSEEAHVVYRVRVEEARTARIAGVLGYAPPQGESDSPELTGLIEAADRSILGTGRQIEFRWESVVNKAAHLEYREPFLFGKPLSATIRWETETFEDQSQWTALARADWQFSAYIAFGLGAQALHTDAGEGWGLLSEIVYDSRDYRPNPTRGTHVQLRGEAYAGDVAFSRAEVDARAFLPLARRHVLVVLAAVARLHGVDIPLSEWYFLGGASSLRGYREREFRGTRRVLTGVEYRVITGPDSHIMGFLDIGDIRQGSTGIGPRVGYGVGVNLDSRGGLIQLQYGLSPGTALVDGKVHIRLGTAF